MMKELFHVRFLTADFARKVVEKFNDNETKVPLRFTSKTAKLTPELVFVSGPDENSIADAMTRLSAMVRLVEHLEKNGTV